MIDITIAITTYSEGQYLDRLLNDISGQQLDGLELEIVILEAGNYSIERAKENLGSFSERLVFIHSPGLNRTKSLNKIFSISRGALIVRLDARSHIFNTYIKEVAGLSSATGAQNVGGVMVPIGLTDKQAIIAHLMRSPFSFGGAKARLLNFKGDADSVYLGAFNKSICNYGTEWFDSAHPRISEDYDLNYRIRENGGRVYIDSSIAVMHYPRESLRKFFKLCYNYGIGKGLFVIKHKKFTAIRQLVPPVAVALFLSLIALSFLDTRFLVFFKIVIFAYFLIISFASLKIAESIYGFFVLFIGFAGCHFFYGLGFLVSPILYFLDLRARDNLGSAN